MSGKHNGSSIDGGIFGTNEPSARAQSHNRGASSIEGGIFGAAAPVAPGSKAGPMTKSSLDGGIFGGYQHVEAPVSRPATTPRVNPESMSCAGAPIVRNEAFVFDDSSSAPLQPLPSARRNNNASSINGGIFGSEPVKHQPSVKRTNPNASSIEGGIFG